MGLSSGKLFQSPSLVEMKTTKDMHNMRHCRDMTETALKAVKNTNSFIFSQPDFESQKKKGKLINISLLTILNRLP